MEKLTTPEQFQEVANEVYHLMTGAYVLPVCETGASLESCYDNPLAVKIENEFEDGKAADQLLDKIWGSRKNLKDKMGIILGDDDDDVLSIVSAYDEMLRIFVRKALEYGYRMGNGEL